MIKLIKKLIIKIIKKALFNYEHPRYSTFIYHIARQYVDYYRGDHNGNMTTNGELRFLKGVIKESMVVFDVGANKGDYARLIRQFSPNAEIHCFEPDKEVFDLISLMGVKKNNIALGDAVGSGTFYRNPDASELNSFYDMSGDSRVYTSTQPIQVAITTLDNYCKDNSITHINLLKIDVEGHELSVMKGAKEMLSTGKIDKIQFEFGYASIYSRIFLRDFFVYLIPLGYEIYKIKPLGLDKIVYSPEEERCPYANFMAIKKSISNSFYG